MGDTKAIFWDVYGTLIAAERGDLDSLIERATELRPAFERTVKNFSLGVLPTRLRDLFLGGIRAERGVPVAEGAARPEVRIEEIWIKVLENCQPERPVTINFAREVALFFERQANPKQLQSRAYEVLVALKQRGLRQGIIAHAQFYTPIQLSELLRDASAGAIRTYESVFDPQLVFFSFDLAASKPDATPFRSAVAALTRENIMPDDCVFVGDSPVNDIGPAGQLGFRTVLYATERVLEPSSEPDLTIHNLSQLLEWL